MGSRVVHTKKTNSTAAGVLISSTSTQDVINYTGKKVRFILAVHM